MKKPNQKGIATVEVILFVIIFALIGFVGWYVMKQDKDNKALTDQPNATSASTPAVKSEPSIGKFVFKEFGLQFDLPSDLNGLTYSAQQITESSGQKSTALYLHLSSPEAKSLLTKCYGKDEPTADGMEFGAISRLEGKYKQPTEQPSDPLLKQFDTFYILHGYPNGITSCTESGVSKSLIQDKTHSLSASFTNAFKKTATEVQ
jgi:hypothetical protein